MGAAQCSACDGHLCPGVASTWRNVNLAGAAVTIVIALVVVSSLF